LSSSYDFSGCSTITEGREENSAGKEKWEEEGVLVATAAEDTSIRIWRHHPSPSPNANTPEMTCLAIVQGHSAGIQTLRFFFPNPGPGGSSEGYLLSSAGSEELFVWRISQIDSAAYDALAVVREAVWDDRTPDRDLRIVDFDVAGWEGTSTTTTTTREGGTITTSSTDEGEGEGRMVITMVLSDSSVRSYIYSPRVGSESGSGGGAFFKLLTSGRYTGACPTQVRHLRVDAEAGAVHVLTAFTDGHVAVWGRTAKTGAAGAGEFNLALVVRLHQSSIKSLDLSAAEGPGRWLVATGGDDNALGFLDLAWDGDKGEYVVRGRYRVSDAHAAAVTGLSVVKAEPGMTEVATASNDQRVKLWRAERSATRGMKVAMLDNRYSSVADAGDLELIAPGKVMVGGVGMEVWDVTGGSIEEG
jgi:WD40 repeat protein